MDDKPLTISISECISGMKIAETIKDRFGTVIVFKGTVMDSYVIQSLRKIGRQNVSVYIENEDKKKNKNNRKESLFTKEYEKYANLIQVLFDETAETGNLEWDRLNDVADYIWKNINNSNEVIKTISEIHSANKYLYYHSLNVAFLSAYLCKWLKMSTNDICNMIIAGLLHDIGKSAISKELLLKDGALSIKEFEAIKEHVAFGYTIVSESNIVNQEVCEGILFHHEREDGSGYPLGVKGDRINQYAKIIAIADVYDAMTSERVHAKKQTPFDVFEFMYNESLKILDIKNVKIFLSYISQYYVGDRVRLSDGRMGEITFIPYEKAHMPLILCGDEFINIGVDSNLRVSKCISKD